MRLAESQERRNIEKEGGAIGGGKSNEKNRKKENGSESLAERGRIREGRVAILSSNIELPSRPLLGEVRGPLIPYPISHQRSARAR